MTDIRDAIKPVVEYFYKESWGNRDLLAPLLLWLTEDFHSDYPERYEADKIFICKYPRILSIAYGDAGHTPKESSHHIVFCDVMREFFT
jgi:hypothetical protein